MALLSCSPGPKSAGTRALETGAKVLQSNAPPSQLDIYLVGFHPMKDDPSQQMEAHHFCKQATEDFAQCALFDGSGKDAKLNGVEYIISEKLFQTLPPDERKYWHPHNYEILSGELIGPGLPEAAEKELMRRKMNSYGKTFHFWMTDKDKLPMGDPHLAWSFNRDGEVRQALVQQMQQELGKDLNSIRRQRQDFVPLAHPQTGVDDLKGKFGPDTHEIPGVDAAH